MSDANDSWIYPYSNSTNGGSSLFRAENLTIQTNAGFDAAAKGFAGTGDNSLGPGGTEPADPGMIFWVQIPVARTLFSFH